MLYGPDVPGELQGETGLSASSRPDQGQQSIGAQQHFQVIEFLTAADESGRRDGQHGRRTDRGVVPPDRRGQGRCLRRWLHSEMCAQGILEGGVGPGRVTVSATAIQGDHELPDEALSGRICRDEAEQLIHHLVVPSEAELSPGPVFDGGQPPLLELDSGR